MNNVNDLDAYARIYAMDPTNQFPIMAMFDFGAAFPSLNQTFLFLVLRAAGLLEGMYNIAEGIYSLVAALGRTATGTDTFLFWILSGVLQGCPWAGSFFVLAMDLFFLFPS